MTEPVLIAGSPSLRAKILTFVLDDDEGEGVLPSQKARPR